MTDIVQRLQAAAMDKDNCPRMDSERWLTVGLAKEAATEIERLRAINADLLTALRALVADILEYERINNLAPNPGKQDCWQSVTQARAAIAKAEG